MSERTFVWFQPPPPPPPPPHFTLSSLACHNLWQLNPFGGFFFFYLLWIARNSNDLLAQQIWLEAFDP
ncbi:hypothetical protein L204_101346 [Cryptococcus depauperatus]